MAPCPVARSANSPLQNEPLRIHIHRRHLPPHLTCSSSHSRTVSGLKLRSVAASQSPSSLSKVSAGGGTPLGAHHHAGRVASCTAHAGRPRDESGRHLSRRDPPVEPSLLVRLDVSRAGRAWPVLLCPGGARIVEPATRQTPGRQDHLAVACVGVRFPALSLEGSIPAPLGKRQPAAGKSKSAP